MNKNKDPIPGSTREFRWKERSVILFIIFASKHSSFLMLYTQFIIYFFLTLTPGFTDKA